MRPSPLNDWVKGPFVWTSGFSVLAIRAAPATGWPPPDCVPVLHLLEVVIFEVLGGVVLKPPWRRTDHLEYELGSRVRSSQSPCPSRQELLALQHTSEKGKVLFYLRRAWGLIAGAPTPPHRTAALLVSSYTRLSLFLPFRWGKWAIVFKNKVKGFWNCVVSFWNPWSPSLKQASLLYISMIQLSV